MPRVPKRIVQVVLSTSAIARYTAASGITAQITEIYLANAGTTDRYVDIFVSGTGTGNRILRRIQVPANGSTVLQDLKIVIPPSSMLAANQDAGADITLTAFGIEEG